jgi:hypothetical protein
MSLDFLRNTANALLATFGKPVTLRRTIKGAYNPLTGVESSPTVTSYPVNTVPPQGVRFSQVNGTLVQSGDMVLMLSAEQLPLIPSPETDEMVVDGQYWTVVAVNPVYAQTVVALYEVLIRA